MFCQVYKMAEKMSDNQELSINCIIKKTELFKFDFQFYRLLHQQKRKND